MADTSQPELSEPHTNGVVDGLTEEEKSKMRPADIDADMREMERRKRVEMMMNSRLFREELERIIETQMKDGSGPSGLLQQISEMMGPQGARFNANVFKNSNCVVPINDIRGVESMGYAKGEKLLRCKLAAVFRLLDLYGWTQGVGGQITARLNQDEEHFLVNPYGLLYHEVTASSLVKVDMQGAVVEQGTTNFGVHVTGFQLHSTIHAARPDIKCIVHIATPSVTAVSSMKCGLLPLGQESIVIGDVSNHQYMGGIFEPEEREKISRNLGPINKVMLLTNRGAICCGATVEEAFFNVYNTVLACETQLKLMPAGLDNMNLISEESKKAIFEASRKPFIPQPSSVAEPSPLAEKLEKRWRIGGTEFEALMRMLDNAGFRTGYIYRHPLIKSEPPRIRNDVEVPPAVSSLGYLLEEEELYKQGLWKGGRKGTDRTRWLNSPNVYQKVEILETGTPDPKKITKWVDQNAEEWVTDGSPTHSSTPVRIESALQFVPKNTNPKEFKQLQQQIKDYRRADKISAGPQSHILEGVTWEEAKKMQDATISGTGEQVVLVGAASKGIIQRGFQHNAMVYKTPYAKNPFDAVTDQELDQYKKDVERKQKGDPYDESQSESEGLSSFNVSRATHESSTAKSPIQSPVSVTSETEEESRDEPRVLRIATKQVPVPSQPEVVLSDDQPVEPKVVETPLIQQARIQAQRMPQNLQRITAVDATTEFLNEMRRTAIEPRNNVNRRDYGQSSTCSSENEGDTYSSWQSSESYEKPHLEVARTTTIAEVMKPVLMKIQNAPLQQLKIENNATNEQKSCDFRKPRRYDVLKRAFLNDYDKRIQAQNAHPPRFVNVDTSAVPKLNEPNFKSANFYNQPPCAVVFNSLNNEDKSLKNNNISNNANIGLNFHDSLFNGEKVTGGFENANLDDRKSNNVIENQPKKISPEIEEFTDWHNGNNIFAEDGVKPLKTVKSMMDNSRRNGKTEEKRNILNQNKTSASKSKKRCARKLNVQTKFVSRSAEDINSDEFIIKDTKSQPMSRSAYVDRSTNTDAVKIDFKIPAGKSKKVESKVESKTVITVDLTIDRRPEVNFTQCINLNFEDRIENDPENNLLSPESLGESLQAPILIQNVLRSNSEDLLKEMSKGVESDLKSEEECIAIDGQTMENCETNIEVDQSQIEENGLFEAQGQEGFEEFQEDEERVHSESLSDENGNHSYENGNLSDENGNRWTSLDENNDQFSPRHKNKKVENIIDLIQYIDDSLNASRNFEASKATSDLESEEIGIDKESEKEIIQEIMYDQENVEENNDEEFFDAKISTNAEGDENQKDFIFSTQESVEDNEDLNNTIICVGNQDHGQAFISETNHEEAEVEVDFMDKNKAITGFDDKEYSNYKTDENRTSVTDESIEIEKENTLTAEEESENLVLSVTANKEEDETQDDLISNCIEGDRKSVNEFISDEIKTLNTKSEEHPPKIFSEDEKAEVDVSPETRDPNPDEELSATEAADKQQEESIPAAKENKNLEEVFSTDVNKKEVKDFIDDNDWDLNEFFLINIIKVSTEVDNKSDKEIISDECETSEAKINEVPAFNIYSPDETLETEDFIEEKNPKMSFNEKGTMTEVEDDKKDAETAVIFLIENKGAENEDDSIVTELFTDEKQIAETKDDSIKDRPFDDEALHDRHEENSDLKISLPDSDLNQKFYIDEEEIMTNVEHSPETNENKEFEETSALTSKKKEVAKIKDDVFDEDDLNLKELFAIDEIEDPEDKEDLIAETEEKEDSITEPEEKEDSEAEEKEDFTAQAKEKEDSIATPEEKEYSLAEAEKKENSKAEDEKKEDSITQAEEKEDSIAAAEEKEDSIAEAEKKENSKAEGEEKEDSITEADEKEDSVAEADGKEDFIAEAEEKKDSISEAEKKEDSVAETEKKQDSIVKAEEKEGFIAETEEKEVSIAAAENIDHPITEIISCDEKETPPKIDEYTQNDNSDNAKDKEVTSDYIASSHEDNDFKYEDFINEMSSTEREKNSSNAKDDEDFNLKEMFSEYEHETNDAEGANEPLHEIFDTEFEKIENPYEEVFSMYDNELTNVERFEAYIDEIFSMNYKEIDVDEIFSGSDNKILLKADQEDIADTMDKDSLNGEISSEDYSFKIISLKEKKAHLDAATEDIRNNIELVSSTSSSKRLERRDSITEMINSINMNITPSKTTYENLPDTDNSLKYNLDPTNMSLIYSLTPSGDITSCKGLCSKNTSIEMLGLGSLEDLEQPDPFRVVKHDLYDFLDLASVKKPRDDFFYLQENERLINSCPNIHFLTDFLSEGSFSDENCSNQGSDILELPNSTYMELKETEEESFRYELNTTVNQILIDLEKTEIYANATNLVDDIIYDISCLNISIDVKNLKEEAKLLMQERIHAVFVAKDIVRGLISNLPCFNELESSSQIEASLVPIAPVNTPAEEEVMEQTDDFESSVIIIEEIVHHIVDKLDCQKHKVYSPKRLKETMNTELKNYPDAFAEDDQNGENKIQDESGLEGLLNNMPDNDVLPCVCPECLPKENLESIEVKRDQESLQDYLNLVNENECEDKGDFVSNLVSEEDQNLVQDEELEGHQDLEIQNQEVEVGDVSCFKTFSDPETTEEDLSNSEIEDHDVLNLKSKIIQMFALDKKKRRKRDSNPRKFKFEKPLDLNSYEDHSPEEKLSGSNSSPSEMHSVESDNFAEQEVTSESTDNDTKSDNSREKEFSKKLDLSVSENEEEEYNKLWQIRENEIEESCKASRLADLEKSPSFIHFGEIDDDVPKKNCTCCMEVSIDDENFPSKLPPIEEMNESVEFGNQIYPKSIDQTLTSPSSDYFTCKDESGSTLMDKTEDPFEASDSDENDAHNATYTISDTSDSDKNEVLEYSADISSNLDVRKPGASLPERMREDQFYDTTLNFADVSASTMYSEQELAKRSARWFDINKQNYYSLACDNLESSREIESSDVDNQLFSRPDKTPAECMSYSYDTREFMKLEKDLEEEGENTVNGDHSDAHHSTFSHSSKEGSMSQDVSVSEESPKKEKKKKKGLRTPSFLKKKKDKKRPVEA